MRATPPAASTKSTGLTALLVSTLASFAGCASPHQLDSSPSLVERMSGEQLAEWDFDMVQTSEQVRLTSPLAADVWRVFQAGDEPAILIEFPQAGFGEDYGFLVVNGSEVYATLRLWGADDGFEWDPFARPVSRPAPAGASSELCDVARRLGSDWESPPEPDALPTFVTWRSTEGCGTVALYCEFWERDEFSQRDQAPEELQLGARVEDLLTRLDLLGVETGVESAPVAKPFLGVAFAAWRDEGVEAYLGCYFSEGVEAMFRFGRTANLEVGGPLPLDDDGLVIAPTEDTARIVGKLSNNRSRGRAVLSRTSAPILEFGPADVLVIEGVSIRQEPAAPPGFSESCSATFGMVWRHVCHEELTVSCKLPRSLDEATRRALTRSAFGAVEKRIE